MTKYLCGDFQSPLEKFLGAGKVKRVGSGKPAESFLRARAFIAEIQSYLKSMTSDDVTWNEDSEAVFAAQYDNEAFLLLGAFAAYQEHPKTVGFWKRTPLPFDSQEDPEMHLGYRRVRDKNARSSYRHLIQNTVEHGYYLPVDFPHPLTLTEDKSIMAGSSVRLLEELDRLGKILGMARDWAQLEKGEGAAPEGDPLGKIKYGWSVLRAAARLSVQHRLPIVFDG
jgi:hypothetical protein